MVSLVCDFARFAYLQGRRCAGPAPERSIDGGMATEAVMAHVVVSSKAATELDRDCIAARRAAAGGCSGGRARAAASSWCTGRPMITLASGLPVYLACGVTDMRKGMVGLSMLVQQTLKVGLVKRIYGRRQAPAVCQVHGTMRFP
jgi:transposase